MVNRAKNKGTAFESAVVTYLNDHGHPDAERRALQGSLDKGDIAGIPGVVLECKNAKTMTLGPWLKEAMVEAVNARATIAVVVHKRRGTTDVGAYFVTTDLRTFLVLLDEGP